MVTATARPGPHDPGYNSRMADRFYTPLPLAPGEFVLDGPDAHHLAAVRRFAAGDRVTLFNGDGYDYPAAVLAADRKRVVVTVETGVPTDRELKFDLVVGAALPKGDRADFLVEKLTELGATRFVPLLAARSVVTPKEAKFEKFSRAVIEASKQCGRNRLMAVDLPARVEAFVPRTDLPLLRLLLHTGDGQTPANLPADAIRGGVAVAVGPEGGFTAEEVAAAVAAGWRVLSLGRRVLRVETAAVAAAAWLAATAGQ